MANRPTKTSTRKDKQEVAKVGNRTTDSPTPPGTKAAKTPESKDFSISIRTMVPGAASPWLRVTSEKTGLAVYLPLPIRLIQELPSGGSLVTGAHGDVSTAKESPLAILDMLNGVPLGGRSEWWIAS
jgi:hypothetical protein